jgi:heterodisulfide reductase subunit A-like polyferredoxin
MFDFETRVGRGTGMVRLGQDGGGEWKGYMMYTSLQELKGFEEENGARRPHGGSNSLVGGVVTGNWRERREKQREFVDGDPTVLVIGAGQAGLSIGARLQQLGVSTLIVDKNERVGDNWRQRYVTEGVARSGC